MKYLNLNHECCKTACCRDGHGANEHRSSELDHSLMASLDQHIRDCTEFLEDGCVAVNRWIDEWFSTMGPAHRKVRHHKEGIEEAKRLFGDIGGLAAAVHILRDCRHIPRRSDYEDGVVDILGLKKDWPVSAYVQYSEEDFKAVVKNQLFGPTGHFLWAFINDSAVGPLLTSSSKLSGEDIEALKPRWTEAVLERAKLAPVGDAQNISTDITPEAKPYVESFLGSLSANSLTRNFGQITFATVPLDALITPLVFLDGEYLESLKPELQSSREIDVIKFALPSVAAMQIRAAMDSSMRNVTFLSSIKTLTVGPCTLTQTPEGTEVKFLVGANLSMILVSLMSGRLIVRNGIHRVALLGRLGIKNIPCILVREDVVPTVFSSAYPAFVPATLALPRPPLIVDFSNLRLSLEAPLQRTQKVIRISADESVLPID